MQLHIFPTRAAAEEAIRALDAPNLTITAHGAGYIIFERYQQLSAVMERCPDLHSLGFGLAALGRTKSSADQARILAEMRQHLRDDTEAFHAACPWILAHLQHADRINTRVSSYDLKHRAEAEVGYLTNGTCIAAMLACGYAHKRQGASPNAWFNVTPASLARLRTVAKKG